jgi:ribosomal protein S1
VLPVKILSINVGARRITASIKAMTEQTDGTVAAETPADADASLETPAENTTADA